MEFIRKHAGLFDVSTQAVIATTLDGKVVYWNTVAAKLYGWKEAEVLGRNIVDVTPAAQTREQAQEIMNTLRAGNTWTGQFRVRSRDGRQFPVHVRDVPVRVSDGELVGIIGVSTPA